MIYYCPTCSWRWNWKFPFLKYNTSCNCHLTHTCFSLHEKEKVSATFNTETQKVQYICKRCNDIHVVKAIKDSLLSIQCCKESSEMVSTSWNTWSKRYCDRCNSAQPSFIRGHCRYCSPCNSYLINYVTGLKLIAYNIHDTTKRGGSFKVCSSCNWLSLSYDKVFKCCNDNKSGI